MTPGARLQAVLDLLRQEGSGHTPFEDVIDRYVRKNRYIGSHDRRYIRGLCYDIFRNRNFLEWLLATHGLELSGHEQKVRWLLLGMLKSHHTTTQILDLFDGKKHHPEPLSGAERNFLKSREVKRQDAPPWVQGEVPFGLFSMWQEAFPHTWLEQALALNEEAPLDLRINSLKTTCCHVLSLLEKAGYKAEKTPWSPMGLRLAARYPVTRMAAFQEGLFEIQDEGSQLISYLVGAQKGEKVVDFCAGAGGKTLALAASMGNGGRLIACDIASWRLQRAQLRLRRAGVHNTMLHILDDGQWLKKHRGTCDRVLVDVPCSGVGTWRRHPEKKWAIQICDVERLVALQRDILNKASFLVRPGGYLFYSTCSLLSCENGDQIQSFLKDSPFELAPFSTLWPPVLSMPCPLGDSFLQLTPRDHQTDGFFLAVLRRTTTEKVG